MSFNLSGMVTMNRNKKLLSSDDVVQPEEVTQIEARLIVQKTLNLVPPIVPRNRKVLSKIVDMGNLPSRLRLQEVEG